MILCNFRHLARARKTECHSNVRNVMVTQQFHLSAKQKSKLNQEYPEGLVGTKYIYDLNTFYIVTFHLNKLLNKRDADI